MLIPFGFFFFIVNQESFAVFRLGLLDSTLCPGARGFVPIGGKEPKNINEIFYWFAIIPFFNHSIIFTAKRFAGRRTRTPEGTKPPGPEPGPIAAMGSPLRNNLVEKNILNPICRLF